MLYLSMKYESFHSSPPSLLIPLSLLKVANYARSISSTSLTHMQVASSACAWATDKEHSRKNNQHLIPIDAYRCTRLLGSLEVHLPVLTF